MSSLLEQHLQTSPEMTDVSGVRVAWQISGYEQEYHALRNGAGLVDLSYGGPVKVTGTAAMETLNRALTRDIEFVAPERAFTSLMLTEDGYPVDIVTILSTGSDEYLVHCSPGRSGRVLAALRSAADAVGGADAQLEDLGDSMSIMAVEGPYAWRVIKEVLGGDYIAIAYQAVLPAEVNDTLVTIARIGLTGEYGYTIFAPNEVASALWAAMAAHSVVIGHRALETAMLEVRQPITHRECGPGGSVLSSGLNWLVDLSKTEFTGRDALLAQRAADQGSRPIGFRTQRGAVAAGDPLFADSERVGQVDYVVDSPTLGCQIGLASVDPHWQASRLAFSTPGQACVQTLAAPYIIPASWTTPIEI
jgi:glycine cleavage system aminomethyltransferase T